MNEPGNLTLNPTPDMDRADCDAMKVSPGPSYLQQYASMIQVVRSLKVLSA